MLQAFILSLMPVLLHSFYDVIQRVSVLHYDVQPFVFVALTMVGSAAVLLMISHAGKDGMATVREPMTWLYSLIDTIMNLLFIFIVFYITTTEANFLARFCIPLAVLFAWFFRNKKQKWYNWLSASTALIACSIIASDIPTEVRGPVFGLIAVYSVLLVLRALTSELHPQSNRADSIMERTRTTGFVLFVMGFMFMGISLLGAGIKEASIGQSNILLDAMPNFIDFFHPATVFIAVVSGIVIYGPATYFFFWANKVAKSEMVLSVTALLPFTVYFIELGFDQFLDMSMMQVSTKDILAGLLCVAGVIFEIYMKSKDRNSEKPRFKKQPTKVIPEPAE